MWIEFLGLLCCGWTALELARLVTKSHRRKRYTKPSARSFGAWDGSGAAIDIEIVQ